MRHLVWLLFFLSGACGLVYEVLWVRILTHVFGTTALAVGTVIAAFMSGLAAGSWFLGRHADASARPLRLYAFLEVGVAVTALGAHVALTHITPVYLAAYEWFGRSDGILGVTRFLLAFVLVMVPTFLMGGTLPVLARFVVRSVSTVGTNLSSLYAINTLGAVAGTITAGFYLIRAHGIHGAVAFAIAGNLGIGILAWLLAPRTEAHPAPLADHEDLATARRPSTRSQSASKLATTRPSNAGGFTLLLIGLGISGFTSFAYEIYWARSLVFLLGNSTYAVTTMLAAFLTGIALGGFLVRFFVDRVADPVALFGWIQVLLGACAVVVLPLLFGFADPAVIREYLIEAADRVTLLVALRFGVAFLVMLVPATLIGTTFPLVGRIGVRELRHTGSAVGRIYAVNTLGNVAGALLPGLVLLPWFGIQHGILAMAALNAGVGLTILWIRAAPHPRLRWGVASAAAISLFILSRVPLQFQFPARNQAPTDRVLYYGEGPSATTKVFMNPDTRERSMSVDGITIGGSGLIDYKQQLLAHLPKLLLDDVSTELSVGLGSAILVGESARHPRVRSITCVEIEPTVVAGAAYFPEESHGVLQDPRLRVVVDDVLNELITSRDLFQVISADEKTLMDYASNGFSYSREYYALLREHLAPAGMVIQWVPTEMPPRLYKLALRTFATSFRHVLLWYSPPSIHAGPTNTLLIGSQHPIDLSLEGIRDRLGQSEPAYEGIARYGLTTAETVLAHFMADEAALRGALGASPLNTLNHPRYEFFTPGDYAEPVWRRILSNQEFLVELRRSAVARLLARMAPHGENGARLETTFAAEELYLAAFAASLAGAPQAEVFRQLEAALAMAPWHESLRSRAFLHYRLAASEAYNRASPPQAARLLQRALTNFGRSATAQTEYGIVLLRLGDLDGAIGALETALALKPRLVLARRVLADALIQANRRPEAAKQLRALLEIEPEDASARETLSRL